jgi:hypothetical protein
MSGSTLLSAVYGYEVTSAHDPLVRVVEKALDHLNEAAVPGSTLSAYRLPRAHVKLGLRLLCQRHALDTVYP